MIDPEIKKYILRLLSRREYARVMIEQKVQQKFRSHNFSDVALYLDKLESLEIINDDRYARIFTDSRLKRGYSLKKIEFLLKQTGVTAKIEAEIDYSIIAARVSQKYKVDFRNNDWQSDRALKTKILHYLQYRGFQYSDLDKITDFCRDL